MPFFDEVTVEEINHTNVANYSPESINSFMTLCETEPVLNEENVRYIWNEENEMLNIYDINNSTKILSISSFGYCDEPEIAKECLKQVFETLVFIGFDD